MRSHVYKILLTFSALGLVWTGCEKESPSEIHSLEKPEVLLISPSAGYGGDTLMVVVANFDADTTTFVTFDGVPLPILSVNRRVIQVAIPQLSLEERSVDAEKKSIVQVGRRGSSEWSEPVEFSYLPVASTFRDDFDHPRGIDIDNGGNVYVSDSEEGVVYKVVGGRVKTVLAEDGLLMATGDIAVDKDGNVFLCGGTQNAIYMIASGGDSIALFTDKVPEPYALDWDRDGNMYVMSGTGGIYKILADKTVQRVDAEGTVRRARSIHIVGDYVYWWERTDRTLRRADISGGVIGTVEDVYSNPKVVATDFAVDVKGNAYVVRDDDGVVLRILAGGNVEEIAQLPAGSYKYIAYSGKYIYVVGLRGTIYKVYTGTLGA